VRIREKLPAENGDHAELVERVRRVKTTAGRALLYDIVPAGLPFDLVDRDMTKRCVSQLINACYRRVGLKETVIFADQLMYLGFRMSTRAGVSIGLDDMVIPPEKQEILERAQQEVKDIEE